MPLEAAKIEIESAKRNLERMKNASSLEEMNEYWTNLLNNFEKAWVKVERHCQPFRQKFEPWQGRYNRLRKDDELLRYVKQARDADNHSIQETTKIIPGSTTGNFVNPLRGYIKEITIINGKVVYYEGDPMIIKTKPTQPEVQMVHNSGRDYPPPSKHLNSEVESLHPVYIAQLALQFYERYINETEIKFFTNK